MKNSRSKVLAAITGLSLVAFAGTSYAATGLFGGAVEDNGYISLVSNTSDGSSANDYSSVSFDVASGTTFASLDSLSADFNVTDDMCAGGSPRFQIALDTGSGTKNMFVYLGDAPNYNDCDQDTWISSANLLSGSFSVDTSQLPGGTFYDTYAHALSTYGSYPVLSVHLVADGGWAAGDGEQTVLVDNVVVGDVSYDFDPAPPSISKDDCKKGGWKDFENSSFKNQGQCISYANHN